MTELRRVRIGDSRSRYVPHLPVPPELSVYESINKVCNESIWRRIKKTLGMGSGCGGVSASPARV